MSVKNSLSTALLSDMGRVRSNNEDAVAEDLDTGLLVLADGMGGYNAGEVASGLAIRTVVEEVRREWTNAPAPSSGIDTAPQYRPETLMLKRAVESAHAAIYAAAQADAEHAGMGTTLVAVLMYDDRMSVAHVGDSRLYRYRFGSLQALTRDHSLLEELVASGQLSRAEATRTVRKNIVTRALGVEPTVRVELIEHELAPGDVLLLCSDGLTDMVPDEKIGLSLRRYGDALNAAARDLIRQALESGGRDNVSVVLARVDRSFARGKPWVQRLREWF